MSCIEDRIQLPCGHVLAFHHAYDDPALPTELPHQKDDIVRLSWNRWLEGPGRAVKPMRVLEIGVCRGGSLALWNFLWGSTVVGIDNNLGQVERACHDHYAEVDIAITTIGMTMPDAAVRQLGTFDMIIDDGGHGPKAVFPTMELCWPMLQPGGTFVIEDWQHDFNEPAKLRTWAEGYVARGEAADLYVYPCILVLAKTS